MIPRKQKTKAIALARALMERGTFDKRQFLEQYTALSQTETAAALGVCLRDVQKFLLPDFYVNTRPKYLLKSVRDWQEKQIRLTNKIRRS